MKHDGVILETCKVSLNKHEKLIAFHLFPDVTMESTWKWKEDILKNRFGITWGWVIDDRTDYS